MEAIREIIIIGGGLAGLAAAIHLAKSGRDVAVIEKHQYPRHKVCGEYVSNEVVPYLESLGVNLNNLDLPQITRFQLSTFTGSCIESDLPLGGFGISRYKLDHLLFERASELGVKFFFERVEDIAFNDEVFTIESSNATLRSKVAIGAYGKRSNIDQKLNRGFISKRSPWLAVKAHYKAEFPSDLVALHNFRGGYCGISKVEGGTVNICYLANSNTFRRAGSIEKFNEKILSVNRHLRDILTSAEMIHDKPMTISQICFSRKPLIESHVLMTGDCAGLIHPLCGNGMAMAIHSAKIASELSQKFLNNEISREDLEHLYVRQWNNQFEKRMRMGRILSSLMLRPVVSRMMLRGLANFPFLLPGIISSTHGNPIPIC